MSVSLHIDPLSQEERPHCSLPLNDADLGLGNANWTKGLQAMSDWIWSGNLNPAAFPNHLARYFLQIPGTFEQQLNFSTALIFDEPSFRNGIQVSGFIERPVRELVISLIAQKRRCWYSMTHHAILGTLTAKKHGISLSVFSEKLLRLSEHSAHANFYTLVEQEIFKFAEAFATNPKTWTNADSDRLKQALREDNRRRYPTEGLWMAKLDTARQAYRSAVAKGQVDEAASQAKAAADKLAPQLSDELNEKLVNAQFVELAFLCLQFVALSDVFTGLNIPDESFLPGVMIDVLPPELIEKINELNKLGGVGLPALVPPQVSIPVGPIAKGDITVDPARLKGSRIPLISYEIDPLQATQDKGVAVGGAQVGAWGWSFGSYFPGSLVYCLMHHPELARFEAPYSLPVLFNEDEWRNGTQTGGFTTRRLKEIVYLKIYSTTRCRYGLEHHTMFLCNLFLDEYGVGRPPRPQLSKAEEAAAKERALKHAENVVLYVQNPQDAPKGTYTELELATIDWVERMITRPHSAWELEDALRKKLKSENQREVEAGIRTLDTTPAIGMEAAYKRLEDHQVAELAMLTGHMDGLGRAMTMLRLESENAVTTKAGFMTDRPGLFDVYNYIGIGVKIQTANELRLNPELNDRVKGMLNNAGSPIRVTATDAEKTGEF
jgi:alkylhydroperoxidase family enzyme